MDFALKQMKAMGWSEGKGLGASENGIKTALKPSVQMDTRGLGFSIEDSIQLQNQWWSEAYNTARKGLKAEYKITSVGVVVKAKKQRPLDDQATDATHDSNEVYNNHFVSAGVLLNNNQEDDDGQQPLPDEDQTTDKKERRKKKRNKNRDEPTADDVELNKPNKIDFHRVFEQAKGMTCHKAARHGIKMSGKMKRIEEQEREFLKKIKSS